MEKEELRIGNLIRHRNEVATVRGITEDDNILIQGETGTFKLKSIHELLPLDITPSWLTHFGFEKDIDNEYVTGYKTKNGFWISQSKIDDSPIQKAGSWYVGEGWTKIDYIHELQNYYYWVNVFKKELGRTQDGK